MDLVLRRYSPPRKQPAQRGRGNTLATAETSSRLAEAALEPDAGPHGMVRDGQGAQQGMERQAQDLPHRSGEAAATGSGKQRQPAAMEPKQGNPSGTREGSTHAEQQHPVAGDQDDNADGEDRPAGSPGSLEWLLRYGDLRNVGRIQQELLNQQQRQQQQQRHQQPPQQQQRGRNGLGGEQESGFPAETVLAGGPPPSSSLPAPPADAPAPEQQQQQQAGRQQQQQARLATGGSQDGPQWGDTSGATGKEPTPVPAPAPVPGGNAVLGSPQPSVVITQHQPQLLRQARATKTPSLGAVARKAVTTGAEPPPLRQQQFTRSAEQQEGAGAGGGGFAAGGARARSAGRDRAGERAPGGGGDAAGLVRRGRPSTEDELLFAANALELLANSGPGAAGQGPGAGGPGGPTASASQGPSAGFGGAGGRMTTSGRGGDAAARGEPSASGRAAGGRGPMGAGGGGGRRGGAGRGMRVGGTGPRIIRGSMPDPDLDEDEGGDRAAAGQTDSYGSVGARGGAARAGPGGGSSPGDSRGRPRAGPGGGGGSYRPGAGRYDGEAGGGGGSGSDGEGRRRHAMYGPPYNDMPDDEAMFGPVPRRPRMSVMCAPTLYEEIVAANSPDLPVQVLLLSSGQLQRLVERQQQMRVAADAAAVAAARQHRLLQKQVAQQQQYQHQQRAWQQQQHQQHFAVTAAAAAQQHQGGAPAAAVLPFGPVGGFGAQALNHEILLRRAYLLQQQRQQHEDGWEDVGDDGRYSGPSAAPPRRGPAGGGGGYPAAPRGPPPPPRQSGGDWAQEDFGPHDGLEPPEDLPPLRRTPPPYGRSYEEAAAAAAAAAAVAQHQQQHALGSLVMRLGGFGRDGAGPQLPLPAMGLHQQLPPLQLHPRGHPHPDFLPPGDGLGEVQPAPKRRGRPPKLRSQGPDFLQPPGSASASQFFDSGSGGGAKRSLSPLEGRGSMPYAVGGGGGSGRASQQQIPYEYDNGGADLDLADDPVIGPPPSYDGAGQRAPRGGREDGADVALDPGRVTGPRVGSGGGGGGGPAGGGGGSAGAVRQRPSGTVQQGRPSFGNAPDSDLDVEELPPPPPPATARASGGAGWQGPGRGGAAGPYGGRQSWQGGSLDDADGGPYGGPADRGQYRSSYDRPEPSGGGSAAAAPSKRQRLADGAPPLNGRSGGRGRGRHTSPGGAMGPVGLGSGAFPGGGGSGGGAPGSGFPSQRPPPSQQDLVTYRPVVEVRDVEEEDEGRSLSLAFLHSTLGTFAGSLKLVTAE